MLIWAAWLCCIAAAIGPAACALGAEIASDLRIGIAVTRPDEKPPTTTISLLDPRSGAVSDVYRDPKEGARVLGRMGGADVLGAVRVIASGEVCAVVGSAVAESGTSEDDVSMLLALEGGRGGKWQRIARLPLCFGQPAPYRAWNRAPVLAVSPDRSRIAVDASRIGEEALAGPAVRVLTMYGAEELRIPLPAKVFEVTDMAWSPDGRHLAYAVSPAGDGSALDESLIAKAGIYLAGAGSGTPVLLHQCLPSALAWGPKADRISIAIRPGRSDKAGIVRTISFPAGKRLEEFSGPGLVEAIAYSEGGEWQAIQVAGDDGQSVRVREVGGDWGRDVYHLAEADGRLALLGWMSMADRSSGQ
ncbi:MAG: hypothetical protein ACE149_15175 [Armatimonadota bacterium]